MSTEELIDGQAFRHALGNFATGITVVTATTNDGTKAGVTANSFNSVSLDPPLILWSIDKKSSSLAVFQNAAHFAVNVLTVAQASLSNQFAGAKEEKFNGVAYSEGLGGAAVLDDCAAVFECEAYDRIEAGDHWILIGKVKRFANGGQAPLLFHKGSYSQVQALSV